MLVIPFSPKLDGAGVAIANRVRFQRKRERVERVRLLIEAGQSARQIHRATGLAPLTISAYRKIITSQVGLPPCKCGRTLGHKGWCFFRVEQSTARQLYLEQCAKRSVVSQEVILAQVRERKEESAWWYLIRQLTPKPARLHVTRRRVAKLTPLMTCYPYIREGEESELLLLVNDAVPKTIQSEVRADVCQELLLAILTGELTQETFIDHVGEYTREAYKQLGDRFKEISLDAPLHRNGQTYTLADVLAAPSVEDDDYCNSLVRSGTPYGGSLADCTTAEDLADRLENAWEANRLLTPRIQTFGTRQSAMRSEDNNRKTDAQISGLGRRKMSSYVRHSNFGPMRPYAKSSKFADGLFFAVQDYRKQRAEQDVGDFAGYMKKQILKNQYQCRCERCGHEWISKKGVPAVCSKCHSPHWNQKRAA